LQTQAAVVRQAGGDYVLEDLELGPPAAHEVLVRMVAVGHCHTDLIGRLGYAGAPMPIVLGHEGAGIVEAVGSDIRSEVSVGDHVVLSFSSCHHCPQCLAGHPAGCSEFVARNAGGYRADGTTSLHDSAGIAVAGRWFGQSSFASYCIADVTGVVKVNVDLPLEQLAPLGCGVQTGAGAVFNVLRPCAGGSIAVFGVGAVGLSTVMAAAVAGCGSIVAIDKDARRLDLAVKLGATATLISGDGLLDRLKDATSGGVDSALDTTANSEILDCALNSLRPRGTLGLVGLGAPTIPATALGGSKTLVGITEGDAIPQLFLPRLISLWEQGRFPFDQMCTSYPLAEIGRAEQEAIEGGVVKPILLPERR
jgi:aryl-alcohol dehydrogenase